MAALGVFPQHIASKQTQLKLDTMGQLDVSFEIRHAADNAPFLFCKGHVLGNDKDATTPDGAPLARVTRRHGLVPGWSIKAGRQGTVATVKWYPPPLRSIEVRFANAAGAGEDVRVQVFREAGDAAAHVLRCGDRTVARFERQERGPLRQFTNTRRNTLITVEPGVDVALMVLIVVAFYTARKNMA